MTIEPMSRTSITQEDADRLMDAAVRNENRATDRRIQDDARTKQIVKMTVAEIFEGVGIDLSTKDGRDRFRAVHEWSADAMDGTGVLRKTAFVGIIGTFITGAAFGLWTILVWVASLGQHK